MIEFLEFDLILGDYLTVFGASEFLRNYILHSTASRWCYIHLCHLPCTIQLIFLDRYIDFVTLIGRFLQVYPTPGFWYFFDTELDHPWCLNFEQITIYVLLFATVPHLDCRL